MSESPNPKSSTPLLHLKDISRVYNMGDVQVEVLRGVQLDIHTGELLAIVGPSGSGKTTLLNLIGGMDAPTTGTIQYRHDEISRANVKELTIHRRHHIGFVFQFFNLVPNLTALENIQIAAEICEHPLDAQEVLKRVGLADRGHHFPAQLSGGEQQRVAIARAIVKDCELLLCDEPTGSLDLETGRRILRLLVDLNRDLGKTIVIITHNIAIADIANRVVHIGSGTIHNVEVNTEPRDPEEVTW